MMNMKLSCNNVKKIMLIIKKYMDYFYNAKKYVYSAEFNVAV